MQVQLRSLRRRRKVLFLYVTGASAPEESLSLQVTRLVGFRSTRAEALVGGDFSFTWISVARWTLSPWLGLCRFLAILCLETQLDRKHGR